MSGSGTGPRGTRRPSGSGTAPCGRPTSTSADRSTSTDIISPDLTSACPDRDASAAVFRPIRRPYGTVSSQEEDFSFFDTEDDDDDDLRFDGISLVFCVFFSLFATVSGE